MHAQLTGRVHRTYQAKVEGVVGRCEERLAWLKQGSRQLFGTLLESRVVILVDTSSSVKNRLPLIKAKVKELLQVGNPHAKIRTKLWPQDPLFSIGVLYKGAHNSPLEVLMGVKVFACCSALKIALASLILFDSERGPKIGKMASL